MKWKKWSRIRGDEKDLNPAAYVVVHPLDDQPEEKVDSARMGPMKMTASVRWSLIALRGYLVLVSALVLYRVVQLAGWIGRR
jgi:hypothetical protein